MFSFYFRDFRFHNHNLLLTKTAKVKSNPQLEIYSEQVKCSHGSTFGYLDKQAIFYLKSRGISQKEASNILKLAFCYEISDNLEKINTQQNIKKLITGKLL